MAKDGKQLEGLVRYIEEQLLPMGFKVEPNVRVYDEDGDQTGEFDVQITGKLGAGSIRWLIECRDRPSSGPQPGAWIEQLVARRDRFNFDKVTAVSTTGFAKPVGRWPPQALRHRGVDWTIGMRPWSAGP